MYPFHIRTWLWDPPLHPPGYSGVDMSKGHVCVPLQLEVPSSVDYLLLAFLEKMGSRSWLGVIIRQVTHIKQKLASAPHTRFNTQG